VAAEHDSPRWYRPIAAGKSSWFITSGVVLLVATGVLTSCGLSRDEWSYHLGYSTGDTALGLEREGESEQMVCKDLLKGAEMPPPMGAEKSGRTIDAGDFIAGCLDALHKLGG
jgi:hypothetical protein